MKIRRFLAVLCLFVAYTTSAQIREVKETPQGISRRLQHEIEMTKDPNLGYVPKFELVRAYQVRKRMVEEQIAAGDRAPFTWTERGPYKDVVGGSNGNTRAGNAITAGRVRAMWVDLADATGNTVWVGGVDGGLWKTTDITSRPAAWTPINDFFGNLSIGSICQDPTNHNIMYFGTGEKAYNADAVRGAGLWMSTDHGVTWAPMPGTSSFYNVSKMQCDAQGNLYVGCIGSSSQGLKRYIKATATWADITPTGLDKRIPDFTLSSTGRLHVICGYFTATGTGYRYTDTPAAVSASTWNSAVTPPPTQYNVAIASSGNTLYALPVNSSWQVTAIYKSTNGGENWAAIPSTPGFTSGQAWYCMAVAIDPNNANNVLVGSMDCYRTTNGGTSWTKVSNWVGTTGQYVHADQQAMIWMPNNRILVASDGGIHLSPDGGTTFTDRNENLRIKQFYSVAVHPTQTDYLLGGTQDNGTHSLNQPGLASSIEVTGGDGAFSHIDQTNGNNQFGAYIYNQYRRSTNGGTSWSSINYSSTTGRFINPTDYDDANDIMYCVGGAGNYVVWSNPVTGSTFTVKSLTALNGATVSAVKVSPFTNNTVYLGSPTGNSSSVLLKVANANGTPTSTSIGAGMFVSNGYVSSIEFGTNENTIIACYANYGINNVWVTTNGGTSWSAIDGNLPNMPVRWAMFYPGNDTKAIIATETGIWQTDLINGSTTIWAPETSFPNVRTDMLQYRASDGLLAAATHGRGMFTASINAVPTCGSVTGLTTTSITTSAAVLSWATLTGAGNYDIEYRQTGSASWIPLLTATTGLTTSLTGLTEFTSYEWRVRANCTNGAIGNFVQQQFTTLSSIPCDATASVSTTGITTTSATANWTAVTGAASYLLQYKLNTSTTWITAGSAITATSFTLTGLQSSSNYSWQVRTNCPTGTSTFVSAPFTTSTPTSCQSQYDITTNNVYTGATQIPFNTDITGLINPSGDWDYYKIVISTSGTATITLTNLVSNYDLYLYSSNGSTLLNKSTNNNNANETITRTFTAGTYYILVRGKLSSNWNATSCYTLRVQLGTATGQLPVGEEIVPELALNVFPNPASDVLHIYIVGMPEAGVLEVIDGTGRQQFKKAVVEMLTSLDIQDLQKGIYFVRLLDDRGHLLRAQKFLKVE